MDAPIRLKKGFAVMAPERLRRIASLGGKTAHLKGTAHKFTREEAIAAGRLGAAARLQRLAALKG